MKTISTTLFVLVLMLIGRVYAKNVERSDYTLSVPEASTEDPADSDIDLDHMTTVNLPNGNTLIILVLDEKALLDKSFERMKISYKSKLKDSQEKEVSCPAKYNGKGIALNGRMNGVKFVFEMRAFSGEKKGYILVTTFLESERGEMIGLTKQLLDSFVIKE